MKKLLLLLLLVPISLYSYNNQNKNWKVNNLKISKESTSRSPFNYSLEVDEINDMLTITFWFNIENSRIIIRDCTGNIIKEYNNEYIYEGKTLSFYDNDMDIYFIEIISPNISINAEVTFDY